MPRRDYECFVIMPFKPELHYMYLFLEKYLKKNFQVTCVRADTRNWTNRLMDKISDSIFNSSFIISDITNGNANVMYETGIADRLNKRVILITQDENNDIPSDLKGREYIHYKLDKHEEFLNKLDKAISKIIHDTDYKELFKKAKKIYDKFVEETNTIVEIVTEEEFIKRIRNKQKIDPIKKTTNLTQYLLPVIIKDNTSLKTMDIVAKWALKAKT
ncbi:MAG: hypothetical protein ACFE96_18645 [Candidatus Hermodarchaeota archaeon]